MRRLIQSIALSMLLLTALLLVLLGSASQRKSLAADEPPFNLGAEKRATTVSPTTESTKELAEKEILLVTQKVPQFHVVDLPVNGDKVLTFTDSLTVDDLRGVKIDDDPPQWVGPGNIMDMKNEPFVAPDIEPFQFKYFTITWDYRGPYYTGKASMYAALHGFNTIFPHLMVTSTQNPTGVYVTELTRIPITPLLGFVRQGFIWDRPNEKGFMQVIGVESGRFDKLPDRAELVRMILTPTITEAGPQLRLIERKEPTYTNYLYLVLDMEDPAIPLDNREAKYYQGFVDSILATAEAARKLGWPSVGIYGWQPSQKSGSDELEPNNCFHTWEERAYQRWDNYGKYIYRDEAINIIYPSVYVHGWYSLHNLGYNYPAFTLANTDMNVRLRRELASQEGVKSKPILPYFWHRIHDADKKYFEWFKGQSIRNEDATAMIAMNFFTGVDGLVLYEWPQTSLWQSIRGSYTMTDTYFEPDKVTINPKWDYIIETPFDLTLSPIGNSSPAIQPTGCLTPEPHSVTQKYDAIHVLEITNTNGVTNVLFQWIDPSKEGGPEQCRYRVNWLWKPGDPYKSLTYPVYEMPASQLVTKLRPFSSAVKGVIEGLALVKPFEYSLRHGEVKYDFPAPANVESQCGWRGLGYRVTAINHCTTEKLFSPAICQLQCRLPIVRRVKIGNYHILITYDPYWDIPKTSPRQIILPEFDGKPFTLTLPVDQQTRIFVVRDADVDLVPIAFPLGCPNTRKCLGISVKNIGATTAPASRATVKYNDSLGNQFLDTLVQNGLSQQIPSLPPGQSVLLRLIQPAHLENNCLHIMVIVDSGDQIAETNEVNNEAEFCILGYNSLH